MSAEWVQLMLSSFAVGASIQLYAQIIRRGRSS